MAGCSWGRGSSREGTQGQRARGALTTRIFRGWLEARRPRRGGRARGGWVTEPRRERTDEDAGWGQRRRVGNSGAPVPPDPVQSRPLRLCPCSCPVHCPVPSGWPGTLLSKRLMLRAWEQPAAGGAGAPRGPLRGSWGLQAALPSLSRGHSLQSGEPGGHLMGTPWRTLLWGAPPLRLLLLQGSAGGPSLLSWGNALLQLRTSAWRPLVHFPCPAPPADAWPVCTLSSRACAPGP